MIMCEKMVGRPRGGGCPIILTPCPYAPNRPRGGGCFYDGTGAASDSHLDLGRAPYALYGVKYIDLVSLW